MATIKDTIISGIENYDTMTAEQKLAALEAATLPGVDTSKYVEKSLFDQKMTELGQKTKQIRDLERDKLTDAEKLAADRKAFDEERAKFNRERNATAIKGIFAANGFKAEDYADLSVIDTFEDADAATAFANSVVKMMQSQKSAAESSAREALIGGKTTPKSGTTPDEASSLRTQYDEAKKKNDFIEQARLISLAFEKGVSLV